LWRDGRKDHQNYRVFRDDRWEARANSSDDTWSAAFSIPWDCFRGYHTEGRPLRINIVRQSGADILAQWVCKTPLEARLTLGSDNPADLGWLLLD
jgi:hypothetical protein